MQAGSVLKTDCSSKGKSSLSHIVFSLWCVQVAPSLNCIIMKGPVPCKNTD